MGMGKRQLLTLFLCSLVPWTIGNGMSSLLPVYAADLGASPAVAGCQMSLYYLALAIGTVSAGWLSDRLQRRKALVIAGGVMSLPTLWLMGRITNTWALAVISATWYFWAGMSITLINILAGLFAEESARGRVFGILALNSGLGSLIGGLAMGRIADRWGYPTLFAVLSLCGLLWPAIGSLLKDARAARAEGADTAAIEHPVGLGRGFHLLFLGSLAATFAGYVFIMGRSLVMNDLGFGAASISTTSAISELPILPLPLLLGWLSDRVGRKQFLVLGCLTATAGLLGLTASVSLWHFWAISILITISFITGAVGTALVADLVPPAALGRGLSLFGATSWIAGILGCAGAGCAVQHFGPVSTSVVGALFPLLAIGLLVPIRGAGQEEGLKAVGLAKATA
jgi:MFS family permease